MLIKEDKEEAIIHARDLLEKYFGKSGQVKALQGEMDENYFLKTEEGESFVFKICAPDTAWEDIHFQNELLLHLEKHQGLELPRLVPGIDNKAAVEIVWNGEKRILRLLTWIEGRLLAFVQPHSSGLLSSLGQACATLVDALEGFDHPGAHRMHKWDPAQAHWLKAPITHFDTEEERAIVGHFFRLFEQQQALYAKLPKSVNQNDANDYNLLVSEDKVYPQINGLIDFGDAVYTYTICELAIAMAYALMDKKDPLSAAHTIIQSYHKHRPLKEEEIAALFSLIAIRLVLTVTSAHITKKEIPENEYLSISEKPAWALLKQLRTFSPDLVHYLFRSACGWEPCPKGEKLLKLLENSNTEWAAPIKKLHSAKVHWMDLGVGALELGNTSNFESTEKFTRQVSRLLEDVGAELGIGKYGEVRPVYTTDSYLEEGNDGPQWRTVHLGLDIFCPADIPVLAALDGQVHSIGENYNGRDYGPTIILQHQVQEQIFYTLYGHLSKASVAQVDVGQTFEKGAIIAAVGGHPENGDWPPHLHFQIITDLLGNSGDFPGVAYPHQLEVWKSISPDPTPLLGLIPPAEDDWNTPKILAHRKKSLGRSLSISYQQPLHIVRGYQQYLYDDKGRRYLDMVNNVAHVGHEHPRIVAAGQQQMALLNTNTRYLHKNLIEFAEDLLATFPEQYKVCHFVNSGSEANELAVRMLKACTGQQDMVVMEQGYHGNTNTCISISSYKFEGKGGKGAPETTHVLPTPNYFRGLYRNADPEATAKYLAHLDKAIQKVEASGRKIAGFIAESILSCAGQIVLPPNYLQAAYRKVREAGGLCVADEVQVGIGRVGEKFWGFELQGVLPDIITIGKPLGNGHPLAAVVTTEAVANAFANGMEYFNTFGGNPVSCAIGRAVLQTVKEEHLQENALKTGMLLLNELKNLQSRYPIIGEVRGQGLFSGFELIKGGEALIPAALEASYLANRMRDKGVLMSTDGPDHNVLKLKPPMCFNEKDVQFFIQQLESVLKEDYLCV